MGSISTMHSDYSELSQNWTTTQFKNWYIHEYTYKSFDRCLSSDVTFLFQIFTCITDSLIPSFVESPPDVESLRVYLTLPLYHRFANLSNYSSLQTPFCKAVLKLKAEACKVVSTWWSSAPPYYFERLVRMYKSVVLHFVKQSTADKVSCAQECLHK